MSGTAQAWGLVICSHCLAILNNFAFESVLCKWRLMGQWRVGWGPAAAFPFLELILGCPSPAFCPNPYLTVDRAPLGWWEGYVRWGARRGNHKCGESQARERACGVSGWGKAVALPATSTATGCGVGNWETGTPWGSPVSHELRQQACGKGRLPCPWPGPPIFIWHWIPQVMQLTLRAVTLSDIWELPHYSQTLVPEQLPRSSHLWVDSLSNGCESQTFLWRASFPSGSALACWEPFYTWPGLGGKLSFLPSFPGGQHFSCLWVCVFVYARTHR